MVDDDIRAKHDLRTTEGKKAAEEDQAERDETLRLKAERDRKISEVAVDLVLPIIIIGGFIFYLVSAVHHHSPGQPFGGLNTWYEWLIFGLIVCLVVGTFMVLAEYYLSLRSQYGRIATLATIALAGWILFWLLQELVYDTKPTSVPSGAVTEKDSSVRNTCEDAECMELDGE